MEMQHITINGEDRKMVRSEGEIEQMHEIIDLITEGKKVDALRRVRVMLSSPCGREHSQLYAAKLVVDMVLQAWNEKN